MFKLKPAGFGFVCSRIPFQSCLFSYLLASLRGGSILSRKKTERKNVAFLLHLLEGVKGMV